jgi:hypothetical protein
LVHRQVRDEGVDMLRCVLDGLASETRKRAKRVRARRVVLCLEFSVEGARYEIALGTSRARLGDDRLAKELGLDSRTGALDTSHQDPESQGFVGGA